MYERTRNVNAAPELLGELSISIDKEIRLGVVSNPNTATKVLWKLGEEFPDKLLMKFITSQIPEILLAVASNPNTPIDLLKEITNKEIETNVRGKFWKLQLRI